MNRTLLIAMSVALGVLVWSSRADAHHGDADRYNQEVITVTGTVDRLEWTNPHARLYVNGKDETGKTVSSHSTSYHARFVDTPWTYLIDKPARSTLVIDIERRGNRPVIINVS